MKMKLGKFLIAITLLYTGCVDKTPLSEANKIFIGKWESNSGTFIEINENGSGSVKHITSGSAEGTVGNVKTSWKGKASVAISGGAITITDNTLKIALLGIESSFDIDTYPYEEDGKQKMKLDGDIYTRK